MPRHANELDEIDKLLIQLLVILFESWRETGFGHLEIESQRIRHDRIAVTILGATHYRYVFNDEDVERWWKAEKVATQPNSETVL